MAPLDTTKSHDLASIHAKRFDGIKRDYTMADVERLRGSLKIEYTLAERGARRLWEKLHTLPYMNTLGTYTGGQAVQMAKAGLEGIYLSGWQVAGEANLSLQMYPDQSLYPVNSVPAIVERINNAFIRADQIDTMEGRKDFDWFLPIIADAEAGFGGPLNAHELMKAMIKAGAAGVHFEDQLASEKKCGHLGGKVLVPISQFVRTLNAARLAADISGTSTVLFARTDAESAKLITSDVDERDHPFIDRSDRTAEGFYRIKKGVGVEYCIARGLAYAEYADLLWWETSRPDLKEARQFAEAIHKKFPGKLLAYNCSPSFNWKSAMDEAAAAKFQAELGAMGYKFQFITLASFHNVLYSTFKLAKAYKERGMAAYSELQQAEFAAEKDGYTAVKHQREVGTSYFDQVSEAISAGQSSTTAMKDSTETDQFH
jgi:isocitrate lyase